MNEEILNRNKNINRGYRKLVVWREAIELYVYVKDKVRNLKEVPYKVRSQAEDSIYSCHSNIAEGYSRRYLKETIQFNNIALASLAENYSQIFALYTAKDIQKEWFDVFDEKHYSLENKLLNYNKSQIEQLKGNSNWRNDYVVKEIVEAYEAEGD